MRMKKIVVVALALAASAATLACSSKSGEKEPVTDDSQELSSWQANWRLVGSLSFGETSTSTRHTGTPRYRAFKFAANGGDKIDLWVRSTNGDPVTWVLDDSFRVVASNDDASANNTNSHIKTTLPAHASRTHYIVVRDYDYAAFDFTVELDGTHDFAACNKDSDCVKVESGCCPLGNYVAVRSAAEDFFHDSLGCAENPVCPKIMVRPSYDMAECNTNTHKCELVAPKDIACGGRTTNPHACPQGYVCQGAANDGTGSCVKRCGGIAGIQCDSGEICVDDPTDNCDPNNGGADCMGTCKTCVQNTMCTNGHHWDAAQCKCVANAQDCRQTGCSTGRWCSFCWGSYACIPNGAMC